MPMFYTYMTTPIGALLLAGDDDFLKRVGFPQGSGRRIPQPDWQENKTPFQQTIRQLAAYFAGELSEFDLPLAPQGTPFQLAVWQALRQIPYGTTTSYGALAKAIGKPQAVRAVGAANGANPIPIIIPCHRVIGSNGKLTGFGGGLETKARLLKLEQPAAGSNPGEQLELQF
jgi:methylated-DNA-[protein]-cysteine S-methyltransferase